MTAADGAAPEKAPETPLFAGIDGGQSSTIAVIGNDRETFARGSGPPADLVGEARDSVRDARAIEVALDAALEAAGLPSETRFAAIVAGISGFDAGISRAPDLARRAARVRIVHDTEIAHAGALGGAAGIVVIAGTGSVALGNDDRPPGTPLGGERDGIAAFVRAGGWGYFFGDEGSALWIARSALRRAMTQFDRAEESLLGEAALAAFGLESLRAVQHAFARGELTRPSLASFAAHVLALASAGDRDADDVRGAAARELADLVRVVDRRLEPGAPRLVSYAGGLFADGAFVETFGIALREAVPHARLASPAAEPAAGALVLARRFLA